MAAVAERVLKTIIRHKYLYTVYFKLKDLGMFVRLSDDVGGW